jgi:hypothetical protein
MKILFSVSLGLLLASCASAPISVINRPSLMSEGKAIVFGTITTDTELEHSRFSMNFIKVDPKGSVFDKIESATLKRVRERRNMSFAIVGGHCVECKSKKPIFFDNGKPVYFFTMTLPASKYIIGSNYDTYSLNSWVSFFSGHIKEVDLKAGSIMYLGNGLFSKDMGKNIFGHEVAAGGTVTFKDMKERDAKIFVEKFQTVNQGEVSSLILDGSWFVGNRNQ